MRRKSLSIHFYPHLPSAADASIQELKYAIQTLLNLYYPTEDLDHVGMLHYYQQREWKIVPNFAVDGKWIYPKLDDDARNELLALNANYFESRLPTGKRRVDECASFPGVARGSIIEAARRILVPDCILSEATNVVAQHRFEIPVERISRVTL
jgi:hypothetical protein